MCITYTTVWLRLSASTPAPYSSDTSMITRSFFGSSRSVDNTVGSRSNCAVHNDMFTAVICCCAELARCASHLSADVPARRGDAAEPAAPLIPAAVAAVGAEHQQQRQCKAGELEGLYGDQGQPRQPRHQLARVQGVVQRHSCTGTQLKREGDDDAAGGGESAVSALRPARVAWPAAYLQQAAVVHALAMRVMCCQPWLRWLLQSVFHTAAKEFTLQHALLLRETRTGTCAGVCLVRKHGGVGMCCCLPHLHSMP